MRFERMRVSGGRREELSKIGLSEEVGAVASVFVGMRTEKWRLRTAEAVRFLLMPRGRDRPLRGPGRQEAPALTGVNGGIAHELSHPTATACVGRTSTRRI